MNKIVNQLRFLVAGMLIFTLSLAFSQQARASSMPKAIVINPSRLNGEVYSLTKVFVEPNDASGVIGELSPGIHFSILGFNESGSYLEITSGEQSVISGWVKTSEVTRSLPVGISWSLTPAYSEPSSKSQIASVLTPGEKIYVLGHSMDGAWMAIENPSSIRTPLYWVATSDIRLPDVSASTASLTKFYLKPDVSSSIINVLYPTYQVILIGRNSSSTWYAVADIRSNKFIGWAQSYDLNGGINKDFLPVIPLQ